MEKIHGSDQILLHHVLSKTSDEQKHITEEKISMLRRQTVSKPIIYIGSTTSSHVAGSKKTLKAVEEYRQEMNVDLEIIEVGSIGLCSLEPIMDVQLPGRCRVSFQKVTGDVVATILDGVLNNFLPSEFALAQYRNPLHQPWFNVPFFDDLPFFKHQHRLLLENCGLINPESIEDYIAWGGYKAFANVISNYTHEEVCDAIDKSGLRGRGGGGFPTGKKWKETLSIAANQKYFICNADESDPGAFMERVLMESDPHLIIEGIAISSYAVGANKAIIYTRNRYALTVIRLEKAIQQAYDLGLLGFNIFDSGFNLDISIRKGPGAYVCGEETALIKSIEGKRGMPNYKPPFPSTKGLHGKPTVVNNVETIANVPHIINNGFEWFNTIGTKQSKGTKLFSVSGKVNRVCLLEVPFGTPLSKLVELAGGVPEGQKLKAVQIGGPSGECIIPEDLQTPIDFESFKNKGLAMGAGGVIVYDDTVCIIDMVKYFMNFIKHESCGKCIPCREGSQRMLDILTAISSRPANSDGHGSLERFKGVILLESMAEVMRDTSLCGLGQTASNPLISALKHFKNEFEEHIFERKCVAGVCRNLRIYYIDMEKCTGCAACAKRCPTNAIIGTPRSPYFVVEEKCIGCGICEEVCKFSSVFFK